MTPQLQHKEHAVDATLKNRQRIFTPSTRTEGPG